MEMTVLANLMEKRQRFSRREHWRYQIQRVLNGAGRLVLIAFGIWCYTVRHQIQILLNDVLTR